MLPPLPCRPLGGRHVGCTTTFLTTRWLTTVWMESVEYGAGWGVGKVIFVARRQWLLSEDGCLFVCFVCTLRLRGTIAPPGKDGFSDGISLCERGTSLCERGTSLCERGTSLCE